MSQMRARSAHYRSVRLPGDGEAHLQYLFHSVDAELFTGHPDVAHQVFPAHARVMLVSFYLSTSK